MESRETYIQDAKILINCSAPDILNTAGDITNKRLPLVGLLIATGGCIALALLAGSISLFALDATLALISIGMGTLLPVTTVAVQNAVVPRELGTTTAAIGFFRHQHLPSFP